MRLLFISQYYIPDVTAAANRITHFAQFMARNGNVVDVVTSFPHKSNINSHLTNQSFEKLFIHRVSVKNTSNRTFSEYLTQYLGFSWNALHTARQLMKKNKYDVVFVTSPPLPIVFITLYLKVLHRAKIILDIRDIWPESAINLNKISRYSVFAIAAKILEKLAYDHADEIICVSKNMQSYISNKTSTKVHVIYNGTSNIRSVSNVYDFKKPLQLYYAGNLGFAQNLENVLKGFIAARNEIPDKEIKFNIIGGGAMSEKLLAVARGSIFKDDINFIGVKTWVETQDILQQANGLIIPIKNAPAFDLTVPSKVFDYMSFGIPIISNISGEGRSILSQNRGNLLIEGESETIFRDAFIKLANNYMSFSEHAVLNKNMAIGFSRDTASKSLLELFKKL